jgi:hypothetical protein
MMTRETTHIIAGHLNDGGAPIELLPLIFQKIASSEGITIGLDIPPPGIVGDRCFAPAEFPAGMLGADAPSGRFGALASNRMPIDLGWLILFRIIAIRLFLVIITH